MEKLTVYRDRNSIRKQADTFSVEPMYGGYVITGYDSEDRMTFLYVTLPGEYFTFEYTDTVEESDADTEA